MAENSGITWTTHTMNPWRGCTKISPGCAHCYAETLSGRNPKTLGVWGPNGTRVVASEGYWQKPLAWDRKAAKAGERHRVFCASLADVFEDWPGPITASNGNPLWWCHGSMSNSPVPAGWNGALEPGCRMATMDDIRERLFDLIGQTPSLDWLLLTKRPENLWDMLPARWYGNPEFTHRMPHNLWLGCTAENQEYFDARWARLQHVPAAVKFISYEPALGPLDISRAEVKPDWVICGAESGGGARPMEEAWANSIRDQCKAAGVAYFHKQMEVAGAITDEIELFPLGLRIHQFPEAK